jgi:hypothetical protein
MNHDPQNEMLSAYLDGELTADEQAQVEHLLATKPAARKMLEELRVLSATLKSLPRQKVGEDLSDIVLRTAELRMASKSADGEKTRTDASTETMHEEKQKMGTDASTEPVPVYSTIIRRLKNPRIWVWEIVVVAVAVMLLVYNPNQNADRNAAPSGNVDRNIAMASKPEEKPASPPESSMRAAASPAAVEMKESLDVQIIRGKRPDTAKGSGSALAEPVAHGAPALAGKQSVATGTSTLAEKQQVATDGDASADKKSAAPSAATLAEPVAPGMQPVALGTQPVALGEESAMRKAGEEIGKTDAASRIDGLEKPAEGKSAAVPEMPARDRGDLAKKDATTFGDKLAGKDMPKAALKAANGGAAVAEPAQPTSPPATGVVIQEQTKSGATQIAGNINASAPPSQNKPAEPPAKKEPSDLAKEKTAPADEMLVVRCEISLEALKNHAFDKILADNAIVWTETQKVAEKEILDYKNPPNTEAIQSLLGTQTDQAAIKPEVGQQLKDARDNLAISTESGPLEIVYVEASPAQIQSLLNGLSAQNETFKKVSVAPAKGDAGIQNAAGDFGYRVVIAGPARVGQVDVEQSVESRQGGFLSGLKSDSSASTGAVLGRAQRIPYSQGDNAKAAGVETGTQKQNLASTAQKGLPATLGYGGGGAGGRLGKSMPADQLGVAPSAASSPAFDTSEQLKSPAQELNQPAAKAEQAPAAAAAVQLFSNKNKEQAANQADHPVPAAQSLQGAEQERQPASAAQNRQDSDSLRRNLQQMPSGTAALPRMERVLFVLQVMERKTATESAGENAEKSSPADAAGVNAPAAEANPSKP